ncbi:MAG: signal peptidase I [Verrucomicrobia bacterium]|nr:signal peptidase I [Verrucomicrobiota bacterium]
MDALIGKISPPPKDAAWRENVEVFLVAIVIAAGIKAYILQPFRIPTGSMQPTLFGIVGTPTTTPPPNLLVRAFEFVWLGRHYIDLKAKEDVVVIDLHERTYANFFTFTDIVCRTRVGKKEIYWLFVPSKPLADHFQVLPGKEYKEGEAIACGHMDTGDQVFVDKVSYNFVKPATGDVFVFKTTGIAEIERQQYRTYSQSARQSGVVPLEFTEYMESVGSQHYIKRLAGMPGQTLRIDPPRLFVNGNVPQQFVFQRVMSEKNGYNGYSNMARLGSPDATYKVPADGYFALGDNSYHSSDSRVWGSVPERNVAGRGLFVYWPFTSRWGLIR